jgi:hypothetical protein
VVRKAGTVGFGVVTGAEAPACSGADDTSLSCQSCHSTAMAPPNARQSAPSIIVGADSRHFTMPITPGLACIRQSGSPGTRPSRAAACNRSTRVASVA